MDTEFLHLVQRVLHRMDVAQGLIAGKHYKTEEQRLIDALEAILCTFGTLDYDAERKKHVLYHKEYGAIIDMQERTGW